MLEVKDYAIILIYPDGKMEKIPIKSYKIGNRIRYEGSHREYFKNHLKASPRFRTLCENCDWNKKYGFHDDINNTLARNNVIELLNLSIKREERIEELEKGKTGKPCFLIIFPDLNNILEKEKEKQIEEFVTNIEEHIDEKYLFAKFDSLKDTVIDMSYVEYLEWIERVKKENNINLIKERVI